MDIDQLGIAGAQSRDGRGDSPANAEHHGDETPPAVAAWRPPAEPTAIPGGDAWLVQRGVPADAAGEAVDQSRGDPREPLREFAGQEGAIQPARQAIVEQVDDRLDAEIEEP